jgi:hypothetical protein
LVRLGELILKKVKMVTYGISTTEEELKGILELQRINLQRNITPDELASQGFVTVEHDLDLLTRMNSPYGHIIAKEEEKVVGYTLVELPEWKYEIPVLIEMFDQIDSIIYEGLPLGESKFFTMGQACVAKSHRGQEVFAGLYAEMKKRMCNDFDYIITEIASRNYRSLRAHEKVGFEVIKTYQIGDGEEWVLILMKLRGDLLQQN